MEYAVIHIVQKRRDGNGAGDYQEVIRLVHKSSERLGTAMGQETVLERDIPEALRRLCEQLEAGSRVDAEILVVLGFNEEELRALRREAEASQIEVICANLDWNYPSTLRPEASLDSGWNFGDERSIGESVRKAWLRGRVRRRGVRIRPIAPTAGELATYFALRYRVYKEEAYIPLELDSATELEIHFSDRWATPIGAFTADGELVACARVVEEYGEENLYRDAIDRLVRERGDPALTKAWRPPAFGYPFDMCLYFRNFETYYRRLVQDRISKAEISRVIVRSDHRGQGLAEVLVDTTVSRARERKTELLFLACKKLHVRLYEKSGFRLLPELQCERFDQYRVEAVAMERRIQDLS
jgi:predicted GNAT family N-acyltransferase